MVEYQGGWLINDIDCLSDNISEESILKREMAMKGLLSPQRSVDENEDDLEVLLLLRGSIL
jgi:hypothetical protein